MEIGHKNLGLFTLNTKDGSRHFQTISYGSLGEGFVNMIRLARVNKKIKKEKKWIGYKGKNGSQFSRRIKTIDLAIVK